MSELTPQQERSMGRVLVSFIFFAIAAGVLFSYERFFIYQDFPVIVEAECDPASESCFVYYCDPEFEECAGDLEEDTWYYKRITKQGNMFPACEDEECPEVSCAEGEPACEVEFCDPEGEEECSDSESLQPADIDVEALVDESAVESGSSPEGENGFTEMAEERIDGEN